LFAVGEPTTKDKNGRCSEKMRLLRTIYTYCQLPNPCGSPRAVSDGQKQHSVSRVILRGKSSCCATRPLSNNSAETLQPHCLFRPQRSKLKRLAPRGLSSGQNWDILAAQRPHLMPCFFAFQDHCCKILTSRAGCALSKKVVASRYKKSHAIKALEQMCVPFCNDDW